MRGGARGATLVLLSAAGWLVAAFGIAIVTAFGLGAVTALLHVAAGTPVTLPSNRDYTLAAVAGFQMSLLLLAIWRARRLPDGLGLGPIRRHGVIAALCAAIVGWVILFGVLLATFPALRDLVRSATPDVLKVDRTSGAALIAAHFG